MYIGSGVFYFYLRATRAESVVGVFFLPARVGPTKQNNTQMFFTLISYKIVNPKSIT